MLNCEKWIWLPEEKYPKNQKSLYSQFLPDANQSYCVAEFKKTWKCAAPG